MKIYLKMQNPISLLASIVWNLSEDKILPSLGRLAPIVLSFAFSSREIKVKNENK